MGAMKNLAIEAMQAEDAAGDRHAFHLGMVYAVRSAMAVRQTCISDLTPEGRATWKATTSIINDVMDTVHYLVGLDDQPED